VELPRPRAQTASEARFERGKSDAARTGCDICRRAIWRYANRRNHRHRKKIHSLLARSSTTRASSTAMDKLTNLVRDLVASDFFLRSHGKPFTIRESTSKKIYEKPIHVRREIRISNIPIRLPICLLHPSPERGIGFHRLLRTCSSPIRSATRSKDVPQTIRIQHSRNWPDLPRPVRI
jgi:hypothetical protein